MIWTCFTNNCTGSIFGIGFFCCSFILLKVIVGLYLKALNVWLTMPPSLFPDSLILTFLKNILSDKIDASMEGPLVLKWWSYQSCVWGRNNSLGGRKGWAARASQTRNQLPWKRNQTLLQQWLSISQEKNKSSPCFHILKEAHFDTRKIRVQMEWACLPSQALCLKHFEYMDFF